MIWSAVPRVKISWMLVRIDGGYDAQSTAIITPEQPLSTLSIAKAVKARTGLPSFMCMFESSLGHFSFCRSLASPHRKAGEKPDAPARD